jgi:hypothetical protein
MPRKEATLQLKRKRKANGKAETETKIAGMLKNHIEECRKEVAKAAVL